VKKGEVVVLIGPSWSGKSTFLRCINGLETFQSGEIDVEEISLHSISRPKPSREDLEAIRQVRLKVGMVFQQFNLFPHMTALENIIEAAVRVLGIDKERAVDEAMAFLKEDKPDREGRKLPGEPFGRRAAEGSHRQGPRHEA
jgi:ABC-type polar amino acid transport system ATPase subunit